MDYSWLVIVPPILVIAATLLTGRMITSFLIGIICSALIVTKGNISAAGLLVVSRLWKNTGLESLSSWNTFWHSWNLLIFLFLISLGMLIALLQQSGAADAFMKIAQQKVKNKQSAEKTSLILSLFFFIDDYFSTLTIGSIMRPLAKACALAPVKSAFLITTMATSLTVISPISSWVGEIVLQIRQAGVDESNSFSLINADPLYAYVRSIPFIIYAIFVIICTWYIVLRRISFGPMAKYDALQMAAQPQTPHISQSNASFFDFIIPIFTLIASIVGGLLATGNSRLFGGTNDFITAFKNSSANQAFFIGGILTLAVTISWLFARKRISFTSCGRALYDGMWLILPSIVMLTHAWTLGSLLKQDLQTGSYIAHLFCYIIMPGLFPLICFIFSAIIAWTIGSSWATMGLVFPIVFDMVKVINNIPLHTPLEQALIVLPIIGATLSGCVFGSHISFISENPIMSCASTGANHIEHIKTMAFYLFPIAIGSAVAYTIIGMTYGCVAIYQSMLFAYAAGLLVAIGILEGANWYEKRKDLIKRS